MVDKKSEDTDEGRLTGPDVDRGHAWVVLAGCFTIYWLIIGTVKSYGILYTEMVSYYGTGSGNTAWIGSLILLLMLGMSPVSNLLSKTYSFRKITFIGGVLMGIGYFLSGFVARMEILYLTLGLCGGLGYGFIFAPTSTIISYYFEHHRALANGIMVSGSGVGALTHPFIYRFLVDTYSLPGAFWILGAFLANVCVAACLLRQPPFLLHEIQQTKDPQHDPQEQAYLLDRTEVDSPQKSNNCLKCGRLNFQFSLFKNPRFTMYCVAFILCMNGYGNNLILIPAQIKALGYDNLHAGYGVNIMGICEVVARLFFGWLADQEWVSRRHLFLLSMFTACVFSFIAPMFNSFLFMAIYAGIIGTFPGSFWSLLSVLIIDVVGMDNFTSAYGLLMLCLAVGVIVSQPCVGWLEDYTGNWSASFILTACLFLLGGLLVSLEPLIIRYFSKADTVNNDHEENKCTGNNVTAVVAHTDETGSLLDDDGAEVHFTSARISRIYRPYDFEKGLKSQHTFPVPTADLEDI
ncbi:monocarboxylate transporter 12-like [Mercenaria mercenaria]|uniref:monocarboxylate transporter 12-like n=1 Tax=Mercenaria mercenaria TaxID=6596 RepID=UPI00234F9E58|nr:monocarboxylate transporter 12-like [Mercenaria mercenaria]XP_045193181.2 monocarboxylate transporter 12-like [Mercenaria mercenaria]XP_045193182.2 monocarboxylate transporter 12-like [Mercenaria mercenaria]XP_045193183.2 monocarboxylate transporter 12-like [Mercenaria mercenaria]